MSNHQAHDTTVHFAGESKGSNLAHPSEDRRNGKTSSFSAMAQLPHKRRTYGIAALLRHIGEGGSSLEADAQIETVLREYLTDEERARVIEALIWTFPADVAADICAAIFEDGGWPDVQLHEASTQEALDDARLWAAGASPRELGAFATACVEAMSDLRRGKFIPWIAKRFGK